MVIKTIKYQKKSYHYINKISLYTSKVVLSWNQLHKDVLIEWTKEDYRIIGVIAYSVILDINLGICTMHCAYRRKYVS